MSRSTKHTPIIGNCGGSDKRDKQLANRRERVLINRLLRCSLAQQPFDVELPLTREISNNCTFKKDGRHWMDVRRRPELLKYLRK